MGHLVANHHTDGTVVAGVVGLGIEEGRLEDTRGEADFVGCGVIIGVDGLRGHEPFVAIDGFVDARFDVVAVAEAAGAHHVLVVRQALVNVEGGIVHPLVGIANLDVEGAEFIVGQAFRFVAHPFLCIDALAEGSLQVSDELLHALLGRFGEVFLHVHLAHGHTQRAFNSRQGTLPARTVLFGTAHRVVVELKGEGAEIIAEIVGRVVHHLERQVGLEVFE